MGSGDWVSAPGDGVGVSDGAVATTGELEAPAGARARARGEDENGSDEPGEATRSRADAATVHGYLPGPVDVDDRLSGYLHRSGGIGSVRWFHPSGPSQLQS